MLKIREVLLGAGFVLAATMAAAAANAPTKAIKIAQYPDCLESSALSTEAVNGGLDEYVFYGRDQDVAEYDSMIEEYLSFHAQVTEDNGASLLMPWSGLRTHAN